MTYLGRLDDEAKEKLFYYNEYIFHKMEELKFPDSYDKETDKYSIEERIEKARLIDENYDSLRGKIDGIPTKDELGSWEANTIQQATVILGLLGFKHIGTVG
ncbi:hypothetical protein ACFFW8_09375 [Erwinia tracheiphila]